jgi:hypothetical protein
MDWPRLRSAIVTTTARIADELHTLPDARFSLTLTA